MIIFMPSPHGDGRGLPRETHRKLSLKSAAVLLKFQQPEGTLNSRTPET